jgi:DNA-binding PadR family transcriptional regulator
MVEGITQPSVTTLVTSLERAGFVERRSDPDDKRVVLVAITAAGSDYLHARRRASIEVFARSSTSCRRTTRRHWPPPSRPCSACASSTRNSATPAPAGPAFD